jgi:hypothetical protein
MKPPPNQVAVQELGAFNRWNVSESWKEFFSDTFTAIFAMQKSGTTALRPTKGLYIGLVYFDTTLGNPVWYSGTAWVDATGAPA